MARNYYVVLGVPVDAAPDAIRSAYRRLALRYHPDRGVEEDPRAFQELAEAYGVLSDPRRRARYDRWLHRVEPALRPARPTSSVGRGAEPLVSEPVTSRGRPGKIRPSLDALMDRLVENLVGVDLPEAEQPEPLDYALILTDEEASQGGRVPVEVPVFAICRRCAGTGRDRIFPCPDCDGEGRLVDRAMVEVRVPAGVRDRTRLDVWLEELGVRNLWLRIHVRVERA